MADGPIIEKITGLDFVLFVELVGLVSPGLNDSAPLVDADMIHPGASFGLTRFSGATIPVGIMDCGFMMGVNGAGRPHSPGSAIQFTGAFHPGTEAVPNDRKTLAALMLPTPDSPTPGATPRIMLLVLPVPAMVPRT